MKQKKPDPFAKSLKSVTRHLRKKSESEQIQQDYGFLEQQKKLREAMRVEILPEKKPATVVEAKGRQPPQPPLESGQKLIVKRYQRGRPDSQYWFYAYYVSTMNNIIRVTTRADNQTLYIYNSTEFNWVVQKVANFPEFVIFDK